jgi:hypothetical protein
MRTDGLWIRWGGRLAMPSGQFHKRKSASGTRRRINSEEKERLAEADPRRFPPPRAYQVIATAFDPLNVLPGGSGQKPGDGSR